jgi:F-box protein 9
VFISRFIRTCLDPVNEMDPQEANPELDSFREKWRAEVRARNQASSGSQQHASSSTSSANSSQPVASIPQRPAQFSASKPKVLETDDDYVQPMVFGDIEPQPAARLAEWKAADPVTALDHYEHAVEKEGQGSLGDSLRLYRKAFRVRIAKCWPFLKICANGYAADGP